MDNYIALIILVSSIAVLGIYNLKTSIYPDYATISIVVCGFIYKIVLSMLKSNWMVLIDGFVGLLILSLPLLVIAFFRHDGFGGGDIKLLAGIGTFLGIKMSLFFVIVSIPIGFIIAWIYKIIPRHTRINFMPTGLIWTFSSILSVILGFNFS